MQTGAELIAAERKRQVSGEGFTAEHDAQHNEGELSTAGSCYAIVAAAQCRWKNEDIDFTVPPEWPWEEQWWKPSPDAVRNLVKAGALIAAEIDRLQGQTP